MPKILIFFIAFLGISSNLYSQYSYYWEKKYGWDGRDEARCVAETQDRGLIIAGSTMNDGHKDIWITKVGYNGVAQWGKTFARSGNDAAESVIVTYDGGIAIAGRTWGDSIRIDKDFDYWIIKLDSAGNLLWDKTLGDKLDDGASCIIETEENKELVVVGYTESPLDFDSDAWIIKLDSLGNQLWEASEGDSQDDKALTVIETSDGGIVFGGFKELVGEAGDRVGWVQKMDANGNYEWEQTFKFNNSHWNIVTSLTETFDKGIVAASYFKSEDLVNYDVCVTKLDQFGGTKWQRYFEGDNWGEATSVIETYSKNLAVTGFTQSSRGEHSDFWIIQLDTAGMAVVDSARIDDASSYKITERTLKTLKSINVDDAAIAELAKIKERTFNDKDEFEEHLVELLGDSAANECVGGVLKHSAETMLTIKRNSLDYSYSIIETADRGLVIAGSTYAVGDIGWDFALIKFKNRYFPDTMQVNFLEPFDYHTATTQPTYNLKICVQSPSPIKKIHIYINDKLAVENALDKLIYNSTNSCLLPYEKSLNLKPGENKIKIISTNNETFLESEIHSIYYLPYLLIDW